MAKKIVYFILLFLFPLSVFATDATEVSCYSVVGFGNSAYDGSYIFYGTHNSQPSFTNGTYYLSYVFSSPFSYWYLDESQIDSMVDYYQQVTGNNFDPQSSAGAYINNSGPGPAGTVTLIDCPSGEASSTPTATSTGPFNHDESLFLVMVLIVLLGLPLWKFVFGGWSKSK